ncbi:uncharacterized protein [Amphiura filiformis]|uniref:uncharacterized protein n=1 Tax=Amphiura filiformis TaxID=82378 RepID=UPI003B224CC5
MARTPHNDHIPAPKRPGKYPNKDRLWNAIIEMLHQCSEYPSDSPEARMGSPSDAQAFVQAILDILWYIDGHHQTLANRVKIPKLFEKFEGYNVPEKMKKRKRERENLKVDRLTDLAYRLSRFQTRSWMKVSNWIVLKDSVDALVDATTQYCTYLKEKNKVGRQQQERLILKKDNYTLELLPICPLPSVRMRDLWLKLQSLGDEEAFVDVNEYAPIDRHQRFRYLTDLQAGLPRKTVLLTFSIGGSTPDYHFIWVARQKEEDNLRMSTSFIDEIKAAMPEYHSRAMRRLYMNRFGLFTKDAPAYVLREIYSDLTHDASGCRNVEETELKMRLEIALAAEDPDIIVDLRSLNGDGSDRFEVFWQHMATYINDKSSVHERRQSTVNYMAVAFSVRDLIEEVSKLCPEGTPIPSQTWTRYQFHPKHPRSMAARLYLKRFNLKLMVQQRLLRLTHVDAHYCAAYFRYMREYAVLHRDHCQMISMDDKHRLKLGEPSYPVAAVDREIEVIVSARQCHGRR